jgi:hypothetical protein
MKPNAVVMRCDHCKYWSLDTDGVYPEYLGLGKWVHVGRVNTVARVRNWIDLADSIDGSGISRFDHMLEDVLAMIRGEHPQQELVA